jgi:hypothetical protein
MELLLSLRSSAFAGALLRAAREAAPDSSMALVGRIAFATSRMVSDGVLGIT